MKAKSFFLAVILSIIAGSLLSLVVGELSSASARAVASFVGFGIISISGMMIAGSRKASKKELAAAPAVQAEKPIARVERSASKTELAAIPTAQAEEPIVHVEKVGGILVTPHVLHAKNLVWYSGSRHGSIVVKPLSRDRISCDINMRVEAEYTPLIKDLIKAVETVLGEERKELRYDSIPTLRTYAKV